MQNEKPYHSFLANNLYPRELKTYDLKNLINFSSNDYLGLAHHPLLMSRANEFIHQYGIGASSSRSVVGNLAIYEKLEKQIAAQMGKSSALILGAGFQANFSILEALLNKDVLGCEPLVFCDRLAHVSMIMGVKSAKRVHRFQHNNLTHLSRLLEKYVTVDQPKFILVESIYSMDGDEADIPGLIVLAQKHQAFLYLDDAHSVGLYGPNGWGKGSEWGPQIDLVMGTFSKALGSFGAYIACSDTVRQYLVNKCKGLIYSTALSPAILGAIEAAIELLPQLTIEREQLNQTSQRVREFFKAEGLNCGTSTTHIIPWIIGDAAKTLRASQLLESLGILGTTIRPPSVPSGQCRIRFCLSSAHSEQNIVQLMDSIRKVDRKL